MLMELSTLEQIMGYTVNLTINISFNSTNASLLLDYDDGVKYHIQYNGNSSYFF